MSFVRRRNPHIEMGNRLIDCDRCGFTIHLHDAIFQQGLRLDKACADKLDNQSPRRN